MKKYWVIGITIFIIISISGCTMTQNFGGTVISSDEAISIINSYKDSLKSMDSYEMLYNYYTISESNEKFQEVDNNYDSILCYSKNQNLFVNSTLSRLYDDILRDIESYKGTISKKETESEIIIYFGNGGYKISLDKKQKNLKNYTFIGFEGMIATNRISYFKPNSSNFTYCSLAVTNPDVLYEECLKNINSTKEKLTENNLKERCSSFASKAAGDYKNESDSLRICIQYYYYNPTCSEHALKFLKLYPDKALEFCNNLVQDRNTENTTEDCYARIVQRLVKDNFEKAESICKEKISTKILKDYCFTFIAGDLAEQNQISQALDYCSDIIVTPYWKDYCIYFEVASGAMSYATPPNKISKEDIERLDNACSSIQFSSDWKKWCISNVEILKNR
jgi:hypothetical protein